MQLECNYGFKRGEKGIWEREIRRKEKVECRAGPVNWSLGLGRG